MEKKMTEARVKKEKKKAIMRLRNIEKRFKGNRDKIEEHILLRTDRMTNEIKKFIWAKILWANGYRKVSYFTRLDAAATSARPFME